MSFTEKLQNGVQRFAGGIQSNKYIMSITNGLMSVFPVTMAGAIASLINGLPIPAYQTFLTDTGLKALTVIPNEITNGLLSLYIVFLVAQKFAEAHRIDGTSAGLLALMAFFVVTPYQASETGTMVALNIRWFGATGLFTAFIIALLVGKIYTEFVVKGWIIKMPESVPPTVAKSFSGFVPGIVVLFVALAIKGLVGLTPFGDLHTMIFALVATPLRALGGTFPAMLIAVIAGHLLWIFGIHGTMVVYSVFIAIWTPLGVENLAAFNAGLPIPHLVTGSLFFQAVAMGSGATLGLALAMLKAKSERYRTIGKLAVVPNALGINEPVIFGLPVVMNPILAIPFMLTPAIIITAAYFLMVTGILNPLPGIATPLGTPIIIAGLIGGGWKWAIFQALTIVLSYVMYKPFFNIMDKKAFEEENQPIEA